MHSHTLLRLSYRKLAGQQKTKNVKRNVGIKDISNIILKSAKQQLQTHECWGENKHRNHIKIKENVNNGYKCGNDVCHRGGGAANWLKKAYPCEEQITTVIRKTARHTDKHGGKRQRTCILNIWHLSFGNIGRGAQISFSYAKYTHIHRGMGAGVCLRVSAKIWYIPNCCRTYQRRRWLWFPNKWLCAVVFVRLTVCVLELMYVHVLIISIAPSECVLMCRRRGALALRGCVNIGPLPRPTTDICTL